jgi:hypothetical protein
MIEAAVTIHLFNPDVGETFYRVMFSESVLAHPDPTDQAILAGQIATEIAERAIERLNVIIRQDVEQYRVQKGSDGAQD